MQEKLVYRVDTDKPFDQVAQALETLPAEHQFRVLAIHDVQATLAEKGLERGPYKIIEICNAGFAHKALDKTPLVGLFMPCRFTVFTEGDKTVVNLARPTLISEMMPDAGLDELAGTVEETMKKIIAEAV
jgi:uncharacterized protein (DUF302 family)